MFASSYSPPVDKLITLGDFDELPEVQNYLQDFGFSVEHIPELVRMTCDSEFSFADIDSSEVWSPAHAVRVLTQLRAEEAIEPISEIPTPKQA